VKQLLVVFLLIIFLSSCGHNEDYKEEANNNTDYNQPYYYFGFFYGDDPIAIINEDCELIKTIEINSFLMSKLKEEQKMCLELKALTKKIDDQSSNAFSE